MIIHDDVCCWSFRFFSGWCCFHELLFTSNNEITVIFSVGLVVITSAKLFAFTFNEKCVGAGCFVPLYPYLDDYGQTIRGIMTLVDTASAIFLVSLFAAASS